MRSVLLASLSALALASACASYDPPTATRLQSPVTAATVDQVKAAIARGEKSIDVGDYSRPFDFDSGGDARAAREAADLMKANGIAARCVGMCGSALAEIVLNAAGCTVTPNGTLKPHLAFVPGGTADQNREAERDSSRWWLEHGGPAGSAASAARADLVTKLERSPTRAWVMSSDELRAEGCRL